MRRKTSVSLVLVAIFCFCVSTIFAQHQLSGTVKDRADGSPVSYATAALLRTDSSVVTGVMSNDMGHFVISNVNPGNYLLQVSFIGYKMEYLRVNVPAQSDLGEISLAEDATMLSEVVITGRRALVEQRLDRLVVNVSENIITSGLNVNDLLKRLPGLIVDQNGDIKLNGRPVTVHIDGRPTRLPADQVAQMLTGMMGDVVDRVELVDNPSSRYEAGMSSAIVNIRLKRDASLGINGTAQTGMGFTENDFVAVGGLNLNYRTQKLNIFGNYGYSKNPDYADISQARVYGGATPVAYDQYSLIHTAAHNHTLRTGVDWFVTSKQTIGFLFNGTVNKGDGTIAAKADITQSGSSEIDSIDMADSRMTNRYNSQMYNLNYRFDITEGENIAIDADYGRVYSKNWQNMQSSYLYVDGSSRRLPTEFQYSGPRNIDILSLKIDYVKPVSAKSRLEAGFKTGQTVTDNEIVYENLNDGKWEFDYNQSNEFKYTEQISAAYVTYSHQFGKFSAMAGLRAEYTSTKGESPTMDATFKRDYLDWFPSTYVQYQINEKQGLNLSYSRKISRPSYNMLNPFRLYVDPFTYTSGNPDLNPSYSNSIGLRYSLGNYSINLGYSIDNDIFSQDFIQDDATRTMSLLPRNIGKRQGLLLSVFAPINITKWYNLQVYTQAMLNMVDTRHSGERFQKDFISAYTSLTHSFTILPTLRANMQMTWSKPSYQGTLYLEDIMTMNAQIEQQLFDRRVSLSLSCNDIFSSEVYKGKIDFANINQVIREDHHRRRIMLTVRYNFGSQQVRGARNRSVGIEEEMGRAR